jgi:hypothetical protein
VPLVPPTAMPAPGTANAAITARAIEAIKSGNCGGRPCMMVIPNELKARAAAAAKKDPKTAAEIEAAAKDAAKAVAPLLKKLDPKNSSSSWGSATQPVPPQPPAAAPKSATAN